MYNILLTWFYLGLFWVYFCCYSLWLDPWGVGCFHSPYEETCSVWGSQWFSAAANGRQVFKNGDNEAPQFIHMSVFSLVLIIYVTMYRMSRRMGNHAGMVLYRCFRASPGSLRGIKYKYKPVCAGIVEVQFDGVSEMREKRLRSSILELSRY